MNGFIYATAQDYNNVLLCKEFICGFSVLDKTVRLNSSYQSSKHTLKGLCQHFCSIWSKVNVIFCKILTLLIAYIAILLLLRVLQSRVDFFDRLLRFLYGLLYSGSGFVHKRIDFVLLDLIFGLFLFLIILIVLSSLFIIFFR